MDFLKSIWFKFLSLIGMAPQAEPDPIEFADEVTEERDNEVPFPVGERYTSLGNAVEKRVARIVEARAEEFERDIRLFAEFLDAHNKDFVQEAIDYEVDWNKVFGAYPDDLVDLIYSRGTNIQLNMTHARLMREMAQAERTERKLLVGRGDTSEGLTLGGQ